MTTPSRASLLDAQITSEVADMRQCSALLARVVSADLAGMAVRDRFEMLISQTEAELGQARDWHELARALKSARTVRQEVLAYVQGVLLREKGVDGGIGQFAERLIDELMRRTGIDRTVLLSVSDAEFLDHTVSMIRSRFPDVRIWNLPVLAHELGHHVAETLSHANPVFRARSRPVAEFLSKQTRTAADRKIALAHMHELFADVYGTYVLGAAYPLNVLTLRASPDGFDDATETHPSWCRRVHTMIAAVNRIASVQPSSAAAHRALASDLAGLWAVLSEGARIDEQQQALATFQADKMVDLLVEHAYPRACYEMPDEVQGVVECLDAGTAGPVDGLAPSDIVNAAWYWRIANWDAKPWRIDAISRRALALCQQADPER